jgi:hypothetical protein
MLMTGEGCYNATRLLVRRWQKQKLISTLIVLSGLPPFSLVDMLQVTGGGFGT